MIFTFINAFYNRIWYQDSWYGWFVERFQYFKIAKINAKNSRITFNYLNRYKMININIYYNVYQTMHIDHTVFGAMFNSSKSVMNCS